MCRSAPIYNHNVPSLLKNWFDLVSLAGKTLRYTETYPMWLIVGRKRGRDQFPQWNPRKPADGCRYPLPAGRTQPDG